MLCNAGSYCYQNTGKKPSEVQFARKLICLYPRLIAAEPDRAVAMFREVLTKFVDKKWRTPEQADDIWMKYKKLVSEVKQFHKDKFPVFKFKMKCPDPDLHR